MEIDTVSQANELLEKANAGLDPELLSSEDARRLLADYARAQKLAAFGVASLARKFEDPSAVARITGTSMGTARAVVSTGTALRDCDELGDALRHGDISLDQAALIAPAVEAAPEATDELLEVARGEAFHVLRDAARKVKLDIEQHDDLFARQRAARSARSYSDELGIIHVHLALEPHVGTPIVARAEDEAQRIARAVSDEDKEPFERYLADAYAALLSGSGKGRATRPELVVLVSHEVATRGWSDVRPGEVCKIPGVGPISPKVARDIATDAFLSGVLYDGTDLRQLKRWSRAIPVEVALALELGDPPHFDGIKCVDCGNRFRTEKDHVHPYALGGPTSHGNLKPRCWSCHRAKTARDRREGRFKPDT